MPGTAPPPQQSASAPGGDDSQREAFVGVAASLNIPEAQAEHLFDSLAARGVRTSLISEAERTSAAAEVAAAILRTDGQRSINRLWERTQATIAIMVTVTTLAVATYKIVRGEPLAGDGPFLLLSNTFFLVVGTYFQRTNHTKVGGVAQVGER